MRKKEREITDIHEIESIFNRADVCRIAMADNNIPYIVTMNYGYSGGLRKTLWFHCSNEGRKLEMIRRNSYVCFQADADHLLVSGEQACDFTMRYSSIVGYGNIYIVTDPDEKKEGLDIIMSHYSSKKEYEYDMGTLSRTTILKLEIEELTGKRR